MTVPFKIFACLWVVNGFSFKMAPTRNIIGFLNSKTLSAVFANNIAKAPCRFMHKCNNCEKFLGAPAITANVAHRNVKCKFSNTCFYYITGSFYLSYLTDLLYF